MTISVLEAAGVRIETPEPNRWMVFPGPITAPDTVVEPIYPMQDRISQRLLVTGGSVTVPYWPQEPPRLATAGAKSYRPLGQPLPLNL